MSVMLCVEAVLAQLGPSLCFWQQELLSSLHLCNATVAC